MQPEAVSFVRLIFVGESSRAYSKVQVVMLWLHSVVLTGAFALLFH